MPTLSILTETTCGPACWCAEGDECHCSCNGTNHGILRSADGVRPQRTSRIGGKVYRMEAVGMGGELRNTADQINRANGPKEVKDYGNGYVVSYPWHETDKGAPARVCPVSKAQEKWEEVSCFLPYSTWMDRPYFLWVREDVKC